MFRPQGDGLAKRFSPTGEALARKPKDQIQVDVPKAGLSR
jgi:hypothetical protein